LILAVVTLKNILSCN